MKVSLCFQFQKAVKSKRPELPVIQLDFVTRFPYSHEKRREAKKKTKKTAIAW